MTPSGFVDPLGLLTAASSPAATIGGVDVGNAVRGGSVRVALDSRGELAIELDPAALPPEPVDYLATTTYKSTGPGLRTDFSGHVDRAVLADGRIKLEASGASLLVEHAAGLLISKGVAPPQLIYEMARSAGMTDDELVISELDDAEPEIFEVIAPLHGLALEAERRIASVTLMPRTDVLPRLAEMEFGDQLDAIDAEAFALSLQSQHRVYLAEQAGLREIDTMLDWLAARFQHGLARTQDGSLQPFERANSRARPHRGDLAVVRGLTSGQRWLRSVTRESMRFTASIRTNDPLLDIDLAALRTTERLALAACRRATSEHEPLARVQAISEAIESLVAEVSVPRRWERAQLRAAMRALPDHLPAGLLEDAKKAIGNLNTPGLMRRFRSLAEHAGLPISDRELGLLDEMRNVRNDAVHGRPAVPPSPPALDYATAIVCRVIVEHLRAETARRTSRHDTTD